MSQGWFQLITPPGPAAIAVVRLVGPGVPQFCQRSLGLQPDRPAVGSFRLATLRDSLGEVLDEVVVSRHSETPSGPELRICLHGSVGLWQVVRAWLSASGWEEAPTDSGSAPLWASAHPAAFAAWARLAEVSTLAAVRWLNHQAEALPAALDAVAHAECTDARRLAAELLARREWIDWYTRPLRIVVIGPPNAGKSTLVNALAGVDVSLVSHEPGTTRDWTEAPGEIAGFPVRWIDTAGLRETLDPLESAGILLARGQVAAADLVCVVLDSAPAARAEQRAFVAGHLALRPAVVALNKCDDGTRPDGLIDAFPSPWRAVAVPISARAGVGLDTLAGQVLASAGRDSAATFRPAPITDSQVRWLESKLADPERAGSNQNVL